MSKYRMMFFLFIVFLLCSKMLFAATLFDTQKVSPYVKILLNRLEQKNLTSTDYKEMGLKKSAAGLEIPLILGKNTSESLRRKIQMLGGDVGTESGRFMTVYVPEDRLNELVRLDEVKYVSYFLPAHPALNVSVPVIQANRVHEGRTPLSRPFKGKNIVIGIIDSGVDYSSSDFRNPDGSTRILYIWDQTTSVKTPAHFNYGTEWTSSDINSGRCTEIDGPKNSGHGTHVTGIAAGNGAPEGKYIGVAPEADIIFVKTDFDFNHIIDGAAYVFRHAEDLKKPSVVNLSLGTQQGPHDGTSPAAQLLAAEVNRGKIIVAAASNEGNVNVHTRLSLSNETKATGFVADSNDKHAVNVDVWYSGGAIDIALAGLDTGLNLLGSSAWVRPGNRISDKTFSANGKSYGIYAIDATETKNPYNGLHHAVIEITNNKGAYDFTSAAITWVLKARGTGTLHAWVYGENGEFGNFTGTRDGLNFVGGNNRYSIGMPATSPAIIAVGAFVTKTEWINYKEQTYRLSTSNAVGDLSKFSSIGPTRDGRIKPDITAPGQVIASAMSANADDLQKRPEWVLPGENYIIMQGTSMASPHVAGTVALMFEEDSDLTPDLAMQYLKQTATFDHYTGSVPNNRWGYGKLNAFNVMVFLAKNKLNPKIKTFLLFDNFPNPLMIRSNLNERTIIRFQLPSIEAVEVKILNLLGQVVRRISLKSQPAGLHEVYWYGRNQQGDFLPSGIYFYELTAGGAHQVKKMLLIR